MDLAECELFNSPAAIARLGKSDGTQA